MQHTVTINPFDDLNIKSNGGFDASIPLNRKNLVLMIRNVSGEEGFWFMNFVKEHKNK
jgi:hypothetical protein